MGLDMTLSKKTYVQNWDFHKEKEKHTISIKKGGKVRKDIKSKRISYIVEEVMYWRKANAIHSWFVENCQNGVDECQESYVSVEQLEELASLCEEVVQTKNTSLLETQSGFFFGSTDYDEYYFQECEETAKVIRELLSEETPEGCNKGSFYYQASW
tara:strand:+ start:5881 stop:6348 length:468 start_codon:yes stop_codon:yes gene_type:complete